MDTTIMTPMAQQPFYFYSPDTNPDARQHGHFVQQIPVYNSNAYTSVPQLPSTPVYSRPTSSCSQPQLQQLQQHIPLLMPQPQPIKPYSAMPPSFMTPMPSPPTPAAAVVGSNGPQQHYFHYPKPAIMLETEFCPATPPLSSASSSISSPGSNDVLATPHNPMLTGLDKAGMSETDKFALAWSSSCTSPPLTPVYIQGQLHHPTAALAPTSKPAGLSSDLLSVSACPSLSPSPSPHTRSIPSDHQDNDFCDPRNLIVSSSSDTGAQSPEAVSPVPTAPCPTVNVSDEDFKVETPSSPAASHADDFVVPHALSSSDEFPDVESDDSFVHELNELVNLNADFASVSRIATPELSGRSRATSAASSNSDFEFFDSWGSSFDSCDNSDDSDTAHPSKRQRTESCSMPIMMSAIADATNNSDSSSEGHNEQADASASEHSGSDSADNADNAGHAEYNDSTSAPMPTSRRGRKQSLTEDPSKTFACDLCNRRFRRQEHLKRHYRSLHTQDKPFTCHECGKKFSRSDNLAQHSRTHGAGAFVMNLYDDSDMVGGTGGYAHGMYSHVGHAIPMGDDYSGMGRVLFQVAADIPGSASEPSSDEGSDKQSKKKRKRSD